VATLVDAAARIEKRLQENIGGSLAEVAAVSGAIETIARQTNLVALSAAAPPRPRRRALCND
jgi:methyl-accepting chemotaxis protein